MLLITYFFLIIWPKSTLDRSYYKHSVIDSDIQVEVLYYFSVTIYTIIFSYVFYQITYVCKKQFNFPKIFEL